MIEFGIIDGYLVVNLSLTGGQLNFRTGWSAVKWSMGSLEAHDCRSHQAEAKHTSHPSDDLAIGLIPLCCNPSCYPPISDFGCLPHSSHHGEH